MDQALRELLGRELDARLEREGKKMACPMCGHKHLGFADGAHINLLQDDIDALRLSGQNIPAVVIICVNCGFMSQHAIGALIPLDKWREMSKAEAERKKVEEANRKESASGAAAGVTKEEERHG